MNRSRISSAASDFKSLSPRPESHVSILKFTKLPHIASTQRLSNKYFLSNTESLTPSSISEQKRKILVMDIPFHTENHVNVLTKNKTGGQMLDSRRNSGILASEEESLKNYDEVSSLKKEIIIQKNQVKNSVFFTQASRIAFLENTIKDIEKSLTFNSELCENYPKININDEGDDAKVEKENVLKINYQVEVLKKEIEKAHEELKKKEMGEKEMFKEKNELISALSQENSKLKDAYITKYLKILCSNFIYRYAHKSLLTENKVLKEHFSKLNQELNDTNTKLQISEMTSKQALDKITNDFILQTNELEQLKDILIKNDTQKRRSTDDLSYLEAENAQIRNEYLKSECQLESLKMKYKNLSDHLSLYETKAKKYDESLEDISNKNRLLVILNAKVSDNDSTIEKLRNYTEQLKQALESQRQQFLQKEKSYEKAIQDLTEQVNNEKVSKQVNAAEAIKFKKQLTLRDSDDTLSNVSKDEIMRYKNRLADAETKAAYLVIEVDRMMKTEAYYKEVLKSKNEIISQMESQIEIYIGNMKLAKEERSEIKDKVFYCVENLRKSFLCQNCKESRCCFAVFPCQHLFCGVCMPKNSRCPLCGEGITLNSAWSFLENLDSLSSKIEEIVQ